MQVHETAPPSRISALQKNQAALRRPDHVCRKARSEHGVEGHRNQAVAIAVLLDVADGREREVETDYRRLLGSSHVVEFVPSLLRQIRIGVEGNMPVRIA